jgi:tetratricopeptide (TPR) repeat protein
MACYCSDSKITVKNMDFDHWRHYARAWLLHFLGRTDAAYAAYAEAHRRQPNKGGAAKHLAAIAADRKNFEAAEFWFRESLRTKPDDAANWFNLGFVLDHAGKPREAIAAFMEATRLQPTLDRAWYGCGRAHGMLGEHREAADKFAQAAKLQPMNGEAFYQLGMAHHQAGHSDKVEAVVRKLVEFDPKRARALVRDSRREDLAPLAPPLPF